MQVRFGIMADAHIEFMHDGAERIRAFLDACLEEKCDFFVDLGDFLPPGEMNAEEKEKILRMLREFPLPRYHVLGNHDTDENEKADVLSYLSAQDGARSFDVGGVHFVLLDACFFRENGREIAYENGNYKRTEGEVPVLPKTELDFLRADLAAAKHPTVIFSHQSLIESRTGIKNPEAFRSAIADAKNGVLLSVCGHEHVDRLEKRDGTYYLCLNSMSYYWAGERYDHETYGRTIEEKHPLLRYVFPYRDPLFAIVEITDAAITVTGRSSTIVGTAPEALNFQKKGLTDKVTASVKNRRLPLL